MAKRLTNKTVAPLPRIGLRPSGAGRDDGLEGHRIESGAARESER